MDSERRRPRTLQGRTLLGLGAAGLVAVVLAGLLAPWLAPQDPFAQPDPPVSGRHLPPLSSRWAVEHGVGRVLLAERLERTDGGLVVYWGDRRQELDASQVQNLTPEGVSDRRLYLLGSDRLGRDVLSRMIYGARLSFKIGLLSAALALTVGIAVGSLAALGPRWADGVLMRAVDGLVAFPWMVLLITLAAVFRGSGEWTLVAILGGTSWMGVSRLARAELLSLKERDFVLAARGLGAGEMRIFFRHLLPNVLTPILVAATLGIGNLILAESALSFLGFGVQPPSPSWGNMIAEARDHMSTAWWEGIFPGIALVLTVIALNLTADGLRDVLDPRSVASRRR